MSDLVQVRQALPMSSVPVSDPQRLGKTPQIISLISIQKCEKLKAKNFTSAGKLLAHIDSKPQKENDVNTFFCCAIKSCWDTMGCCQSKRPRLTPLLLTLGPVFPHLCIDQMIYAQELCIETMLSTKAGLQCVFPEFFPESNWRRAVS